ncbi:hypothetical protein J1N35_044681, partial [Gossypium stocksii]
MRDATLMRSLQKNFTKPMPVFLEFHKEQQAFIEEMMGEVEPGKVELASTKPAVAEKETKVPEEEATKTESVNIENDQEGIEETTTTPVPIEATSIQNCKIHRITAEITESDKEKEDMPLYSLKRKIRFQHSTHKSTHRH